MYSRYKNNLYQFYLIADSIPYVNPLADLVTQIATQVDQAR
jgi:hypothetical protein